MLNYAKQSIKSSMSQPQQTPATPQMHGYGGYMPGFDVNHIVQIQFAGIMMKLVETMNDKSTSLLSFDKIVTFLLLLLITDIKKWLLEFIEFAKKFVTTNMPTWGITAWEHIVHWWQAFRSMMAMSTPMQPHPLPQCEQIDEFIYPPLQNRITVNFELNAYNMNALYQYITMPADERAKLGAQCPQDTMVIARVDPTLTTKIVSKDNISSDVVYKTIDIAITDSLSMSMYNIGFNVNNVTNTLVGINATDLTNDPMDQTFGNIEDNDIFKWMVEGNMKSYFDDQIKPKNITLKHFVDKTITVDSIIYELFHHNNFIIDVNHISSHFPRTATNMNMIPPIYELFILYLIKSGNFEKLQQKQPVDLMKLYQSLLILMIISYNNALAFRLKDNGDNTYQYIISSSTSSIIPLLPNTLSCASKALNYIYNKISNTIIQMQTYQAYRFTLYTDIAKMPLPTTTSTSTPTITFTSTTTSTPTSTQPRQTTKSTQITLLTTHQNLPSTVIYSDFLKFYTTVIMRAPDAVKATQFTANKAITVYVISYKKTDVTTMVENPEYTEWAEMMQYISGNGGGNASTAATAAAAEEHPPKQPTPELTIARLDAYKIKPPKMIKQQSATTELICEKVNSIYKNLASLYLSEPDKRKITSIVDKFKNRKDFYEQLGIPYKLGIMLYGHPGTGKTSTIKAVASYLEKDIYFVNLKNVRTNAELKGIFDHINEKCNGGVIVFEDMDASCEVIKRRIGMAETRPDSIADLTTDINAPINDQLTLSYLLNLFDGTICRDGTIFAITTNHLENIDPALYRPGRVDIQIEFHKCDHDQIKQIFQHIIGRPLAADVLEKIPKYTYAPAEIIFEIMHYGLNDCATDQEIMARFISGGDSK